MTEPAPTGGDTATVEALRRVKAVEAEWDGKLADARRQAEEATRRARDEAEATVKAVAAELETERARQLDSARASAEREAEGLRTDGAKAAEAVRSGQGRRPQERGDEIVAAVLGPFAGG